MEFLKIEIDEVKLSKIEIQIVEFSKCNHFRKLNFNKANIKN